MSSKRKIMQAEPAENILKRSKKSWKAVTAAENYFMEGRYGKALPLLFKYEDCEARAMMFLAYMYFEGVGCVEDMPRGVSYLQKLVNTDDIRPGEEGVLAIALFYMGELYYRGIIVPKDNELAEKYWIRGAAIQKNPVTGLHHYGSVECQTALGMFYSNREFLDLKKAFQWHKMAQESGSVVSEGALGAMYLHGLGTDENLRLAYHHLTTAAAHGNTYAKGYLAAYYYKRQMFERTAIVGRELAAVQDCKPLAKAEGCPVEHVKRGVSMGCFYLALCCQYGHGAIQDKAFAVKLIKKAIELSPDVAYDLHAKAILGTA